MDITSEPTGGLPDSITSHRHIPPAPRRVARRSQNHILRATAKRRACAGELPPPGENAFRHRRDRARETLSARNSHRHKEHRAEQLADEIGGDLIVREVPCTKWPSAKGLGPRSAPDSRAGWGSDVDEGRDLARSAVPLPSDAARTVSRRSLERQDAFCDADTFKGSNVRLRRRAALASSDDDAQVAELYHMGLLYDDDRDAAAAAEPFSLNSIRHDEPVYAVRPSKRARKLNKTRGYDVDPPLDLDLSFADLGDDEAIAHYLMSPSHSETEDNDAAGETIQHRSRHSGQAFAPLRVIYELVGSRPSFDVETSQPPDLVDDDILSDYDCFSDSELDGTHTPTQRELQEDGGSGSHSDGDAAAAPTNDAPTDPWVMLD